VLTWCKRFRPDIIFLQETHCISDRESWYKDIFNNDWFHSGDSHNSRGASIMISKSLDYKVIESVLDDNGRYVIIDIVIEGRKYLLGNYYGPNIDCPEHLEEYLNLLIPSDGQEIISAGDYNLVMDVHMDKRGGLARTHEKSKNLLKCWCNNMETMDVWRVKHPDTFDYTWKSWKPPHIYCRLDFFIISNSLCNNRYLDEKCYTCYLVHFCFSLNISL